MNEFEKSFKEEIREKKRTASGVHGKKGKRGFVGSMRTPADLLTSPKERRDYEGTSPVRTSKINPTDEIISHEEFKKLNRQGKTLLLYKLRSKHTAKEIADTWGLSDKTIYYLYRAYGVTRGKTAPEQENANLEIGHSDFRNDKADEKDGKMSDSKPASEDRTFPKNECSFMLIGDFEAQSLGKKLNGLAFMLDDKLKYQVEIHVKEIAQE